MSQPSRDVEADLPGVAREDVNATLVGNELTSPARRAGAAQVDEISS